MPDRVKRRRVLLLVAALLVVVAGVASLAVWALLGGLEKELVPAYTKPQAGWQDVREPLIRTRWKQDGPYAALSPRHELLGCWSVAFAQVLAHHRLQPGGRVRYRTHAGLAIDEALGQPVAWHRIQTIGSGTSAEASLETARYLYAAAVVVQKDFGRGEYMDVSRIPGEITEHYGARVQRIDSSIPGAVTSELAAARPLVAYFDDILSIHLVRNGHAAVLDGAATENGRLLVHVNFGWGGASDGWYVLGDLARERKLLYVFRIVPSPAQD